MKENQLAVEAAQILYDKKGQKIVALDVSALTVITEAMVICNGRNTIQVKTLADEVEDKLAQRGVLPLRKEGHQDGRWIVLDYGTVLVHVFHSEEREFYRLDKLWDDGTNRIALPFEDEDQTEE